MSNRILTQENTNTPNQEEIDAKRQKNLAYVLAIIFATGAITYAVATYFLQPDTPKNEPPNHIEITLFYHPDDNYNP